MCRKEARGSFEVSLTAQSSKEAAAPLSTSMPAKHLRAEQSEGHLCHRV